MAGTSSDRPLRSRLGNAALVPLSARRLERRIAVLRDAVPQGHGPG